MYIYVFVFLIYLHKYFSKPSEREIRAGVRSANGRRVYIAHCLFIHSHFYRGAETTSTNTDVMLNYMKIQIFGFTLQQHLINFHSATQYHGYNIHIGSLIWMIYWLPLKRKVLSISLSSSMKYHLAK